MKNIKNIAIVLMLFIIAILIETREKRPISPKVIVRKEYDSVPWVFKAKLPIPTSKPIIKYITIKEKPKIDSEAIYKAYMGKVTYHQVIKNDSLAYIKLNQVISQNRIISQHLIYIPKRPTIYSETVIKENKPAIRILAGASIMGVLQKTYMFGEIGLLTRKDNLYRIGYDPFQKIFEFGILFKLKMRKKPP